MRRIGKVLLSLLLLLVCNFVLFARDIKVEGTGDTEEKAKRDAEFRLSSLFSTSISFTEISYVYDDSNTASQGLLSSTTVRTGISGVVLSGVQYDSSKVSEGFRCTIIIPESTLGLYMEKVSKSASDIDSLYAKCSSSALSNKEKLGYLESSLSEYESFNAYSAIAYMLNDDKAVSIADPVNAYATIKAEYLNLLEKIDEELQAEISSALRDWDSADFEETLASIRQQQSEIKRRLLQEEQEKEEWRKQLLEKTSIENRQKLNELIAKAEENIKKYEAGSTVSVFDTLTILYEQTVKYREMETDFTTQIKALESKRDADMLQKEKDMRSAKKWSTAETNSSGVPTEEAKKVFNEEIENEKEKIYQQYAPSIKELSKAKDKELNKINEQIDKKKKVLLKGNYTIDSRSDVNAYLSIGKYDGANYGWPVTVHISILGNEMEYETFISYKEFTGKNISNITKMTAKERETYFSDVELYEALLANTSPSPIGFVFEFSFSKYDPDSHINSMVIEELKALEIELIPSEIRYIRLDTGKTIKTQKLMVNEKNFSYAIGVAYARTSSSIYPDKMFSARALIYGDKGLNVNVGMGAGTVSEKKVFSLSLVTSYEYPLTDGAICKCLLGPALFLDVSPELMSLGIGCTLRLAATVKGPPVNNLGFVFNEMGIVNSICVRARGVSFSFCFYWGFDKE